MRHRPRTLVFETLLFGWLKGNTFKFGGIFKREHFERTNAEFMRCSRTRWALTGDVIVISTTRLYNSNFRKFVRNFTFSNFEKGAFLHLFIFALGLDFSRKKNDKSKVGQVGFGVGATFSCVSPTFFRKKFFFREGEEGDPNFSKF
jgi:hypothetical protein